VNAGAWAQLETAVRRLAAHSDAVYIFTGPIFDSVNESSCADPSQEAQFGYGFCTVRTKRNRWPSAVTPYF